MPFGQTFLYAFYFILFIVGGAYFAGAEISLASVNKIHMMSAADNDDQRAKKVLIILDRFDEALSALLIGNNIMHIGCATLSTVLATDLVKKYATFSETYAVTLSTVITTVVLFLFAEMIPKCYAKSCNEKFAREIAPSLLFIMKILAPLSRFFTAISRFLSKPFLDEKETEPTLTEDELQDLVETITENNDSFNEETAELVQSAMEFSQSTAKDLLIPWENVEKISTQLKTPEILNICKNTTHSRLPVVDRSGKLKGILSIRTFFKAYLKKRKNIVLASIYTSPFYTTPEIPIDDLLTQMSKHRKNLAVVKENGAILGIITVEDILERLVGEIYDESDKPEEPLQNGGAKK